MASIGGNATTTVRRAYDAGASKAALLAAASELFDEVGYERATTREIGERAGVDPAMIARYFDSKEGLFLAALAESPGDEDIDFEPAALLALLIEWWDERGHSPISRALASPSLTPGVREAVRGVVRRRILAQLAEVLRERGAADPELRAELLVALAVGVAMTRANGTLEEVANSSREDLLAVLRPAAEALGAWFCYD
jgi:AcrR family transcriptional regulator